MFIVASDILTGLKGEIRNVRKQKQEEFRLEEIEEMAKKAYKYRNCITERNTNSVRENYETGA